MKRIDQIRNMSMEAMAKEIIKLNITDHYCKGTCPDVWTEHADICQDELNCCIRWLEEEV